MGACPGPALGSTVVTVVGAAMYVKSSELLVALLPPTVVTVTFTVPTEPTGDSAVIDVAVTTVKLFAATVPNLTSLAPVKFVPVIVTFVEPVVPSFTAVSTEAPRSTDAPRGRGGSYLSFGMISRDEEQSRCRKG